MDLVHTYGDMNTCLAREQLSCTISFNAFGASSSLDGTERCAAAWSSVSCDDFYNNNPPPDCIGRGAQLQDEPCTFNGQCASSYCLGNKTSTCGTCGPAPAVGDSCVDSNCARGQQCVFRTATCEVPGIAQAACDNNSMPCGPDLACVGSTPTALGSCMPGIATAGARCGGTLSGCDGTFGLTCSGPSANKTCVAIQYETNGKPCGQINGTFVSCALGQCFTATGPTMAGETGTCKTNAADGQPCDVQLGPLCTSPARCIITGSGAAGTCTIPSADSCVSSVSVTTG
jgi:hypothetical protein